MNTLPECLCTCQNAEHVDLSKHTADCEYRNAFSGSTRYDTIALYFQQICNVSITSGIACSISRNLCSCGFPGAIPLHHHQQDCIYRQFITETPEAYSGLIVAVNTHLVFTNVQPRDMLTASERLCHLCQHYEVCHAARQAGRLISDSPHQFNLVTGGEKISEVFGLLARTCFKYAPKS